MLHFLSRRDVERQRSVNRRVDTLLPPGNPGGHPAYTLPVLACASTDVAKQALGTFNLQEQKPGALANSGQTRDAYAACDLTAGDLVSLQYHIGAKSGGFWLATKCDAAAGGAADCKCAPFDVSQELLDVLEANGTISAAEKATVQTVLDEGKTKCDCDPVVMCNNCPVPTSARITGLIPLISVYQRRGISGVQDIIIEYPTAEHAAALGNWLTLAPSTDGFQCRYFATGSYNATVNVWEDTSVGLVDDPPVKGAQLVNGAIIQFDFILTVTLGESGSTMNDGGRVLFDPSVPQPDLASHLPEPGGWLNQGGSSVITSDFELANSTGCLQASNPIAERASGLVNLPVPAWDTSGAALELQF